MSPAERRTIHVEFGLRLDAVQCEREREARGAAAGGSVAREVEREVEFRPIRAGAAKDLGERGGGVRLAVVVEGEEADADALRELAELVKIALPTSCRTATVFFSVIMPDMCYIMSSEH